MPRPKVKKVSTLKPMGFAMNPGTKNIDSPGTFSLNNTNTISSLNPDPKKPTTTLKNALASDKDYQLVPGYQERLGGELKEVVVTAKPKKTKKKSYREQHGVTRVGGFIDDVKYGRIFKRPLNWQTLSSRRKERRVRKQKWWGNN